MSSDLDTKFLCWFNIIQLYHKVFYFTLCKSTSAYSLSYFQGIARGRSILEFHTVYSLLLTSLYPNILTDEQIFRVLQKKFYASYFFVILLLVTEVLVRKHENLFLQTGFQLFYVNNLCKIGIRNLKNMRSCTKKNLFTAFCQSDARNLCFDKIVYK